MLRRAWIVAPTLKLPTPWTGALAVSSGEPVPSCPFLTGTLAKPIRMAPTSLPSTSRPLRAFLALTASSRRSKLTRSGSGSQQEAKMDEGKKLTETTVLVCKYPS